MSIDKSDTREIYLLFINIYVFGYFR